MHLTTASSCTQPARTFFSLGKRLRCDGLPELAIFSDLVAAESQHNIDFFPPVIKGLRVARVSDRIKGTLEKCNNMVAAAVLELSLLKSGDKSVPLCHPRMWVGDAALRQ